MAISWPHADLHSPPTGEDGVHFANVFEFAKKSTFYLLSQREILLFRSNAMPCSSKPIHGMNKQRSLNLLPVVLG
jgi:hypothetical protein